MQQIVKLNWETLTPVLECRSADLSTTQIDLARDPLAFEIQAQKTCIGSLNLDDLSITPCREQRDLWGKKQKQCYVCSERTGFSPCISCKGQLCEATQREAISYCGTPHQVYLAYYPGNLIKVGTTSSIRAKQRLLEQGAEFALLVAQADGMRVRRIEKAVSALSFPEVVKRDYKFQKLNIKVRPQEAFNALYLALEKLKQQLPPELLEHFQQPELLDFSDCFKTERITQLPQRLEPVSGLAITGEFVTVKGDILVFRQQRDLFAIALEPLCGYYIAAAKDSVPIMVERVQQQLSFF
jgi:hypothetical protein